MKSTRGLSDVVTTVLLIGLTIAATGIIWAVVNGLVKEKVDDTSSCFGVFGKAEVNSQYTCYDSVSDKLRFSISIGDLDLDEMLVGISSPENSISFTLNKSDVAISHVTPYPAGTGNVKLPEKNSGKTYLLAVTAAGFSGIPDKIEIVPVINGNRCGTIDTFTEISNCG